MQIHAFRPVMGSTPRFGLLTEAQKNDKSDVILQNRQQRVAVLKERYPLETLVKRLVLMTHPQPKQPVVIPPDELSTDIPSLLEEHEMAIVDLLQTMPMLSPKKMADISSVISRHSAQIQPNGQVREPIGFKTKASSQSQAKSTEELEAASKELESSLDTGRIVVLMSLIEKAPGYQPSQALWSTLLGKYQDSLRL